MEQQFNNVINFGIGCLKALSGGYSQISEQIKNSVSDLIRNGEKANGETAVKIRDVAHKATRFLNRTGTEQKTTRAG